MEQIKLKKKREVMTIQEYLNRRKQQQKNKEQNLKVLTKFEWNVMINE